MVLTELSGLRFCSYRSEIILYVKRKKYMSPEYHWFLDIVYFKALIF